MSSARKTKRPRVVMLLINVVDLYQSNANAIILSSQ
jgi:hypothetical protein